MAVDATNSSAEGDGAGWAAALAEHGRWLRTVILARTGEAAAVEDVFQEVALAAIRQPVGRLAAVSIRPWLYRLAVRQALLHRRKSGRQRRLAQRWARRRYQEANGEADPGEWLLAVEQRESVQAALQCLTSKDREILLLKYTEGWSYQHLAEHLGISESALEARLHRSRHRLREELIRSATLEALP